MRILSHEMDDDRSKLRENSIIWKIFDNLITLIINLFKKRLKKKRSTIYGINQFA